MPPYALYLEIWIAVHFSGVAFNASWPCSIGVCMQYSITNVTVALACSKEFPDTLGQWLDGVADTGQNRIVEIQ